MSRVMYRRKRRTPKRARAARRQPHPRSGRPPAPDAERADPDTLPRLSQRERQIVALLIAGRTVKEAAATLGLSPRTVEGYLERLKRRFRVPRLLALVVHLVKQGLVE